MVNEITCEKAFIGEVFGNMWFSIPTYQRLYVWGKDEVTDLLDDVVAAMNSSGTDEYFIGSFVIRPVKVSNDGPIEYTENELLDGQQRLTTLMLTFSILRDLTEKPDSIKTCTEAIFQASSKARAIPERVRVIFHIRDAAQEFLEKLKVYGSTAELAAKDNETIIDISVRNMANSLFEIKEFILDQNVNVDDLIKYLWQKTSLIYVSTEQLNDAIRLFNVLNNRGLPLRNSDILKSVNLNALETEKDKKKFALLWEGAETFFNDDFDRFLGYIRTVLVKEKARTGLSQEFEEKIYGRKKGAPLQKGKPTFDMVGRYHKHYETLFSNQNFQSDSLHSLDNLIFVMNKGFPSSDWIPPMLMYFDKFEFHLLLDFLGLLDNLFSSDWILGYTPTKRIEKMNGLMKSIEMAKFPKDVFEYESFYLDEVEWEDLADVISRKIYRKKFDKYLLLKLNLLNGNKSQKMYFSKISIEHILPQNPKEGSVWFNDFSEKERDDLTDKIGNLVIIGRSKNSALSNEDFLIKMDRYFKESLESIPHTMKTLSKKTSWTPKIVLKNQKAVLEQLKERYLLNK